MSNTQIIPPRRFSSAEWRQHQLEASKADLGKNWVLHPQYKPTLAHRYSGSLIMEKVKADALKRGVIL